VAQNDYVLQIWEGKHKFGYAYVCDLCCTTSVAVTEFVLLILEHLSGHRIVSKVKQCPCLASGQLDNRYSCILLLIPFVTAGQS